MAQRDVLVIGAGVFGLTAAVELRQRGHAVTVLDPANPGDPLAQQIRPGAGEVPGAEALPGAGASMDINKAVRMGYGADRLYQDMVDRAIDGWQAWNERFGERVYEETGVLMLAGGAMAAGGFEFESLRTAEAAGHGVERVDAAAIAARFGAWRDGKYVDGYFQARGGYTRSALTVRALAKYARQIGVVVRPGVAAARLVEEDGRVAGAATRDGEVLAAEHTVVAAGVWTAGLVPELRPYLRATAHPIYYLRPADPERFRPPRFCVFCADVANTGWYGFPVDEQTGLVKLAKHDAGDAVAPDDTRGGVSEARIAELRAFLRDRLPALADAELVAAKHCFYTDTLDGHLWIDRPPRPRPRKDGPQDSEHSGKGGLTVATGGCGHAMKFAPVLGGLIADAVEGKKNPWLERFRWREKASDVPGDAARAIG